MSRYGSPHPSFYYYQHLYNRPYYRGRGWFGLSHLVALGVGLWAGSHFSRSRYDYGHHYWGHHFNKDFCRAVEGQKKTDLASGENSFQQSFPKQP